MLLNPGIYIVHIVYLHTRNISYINIYPIVGVSRSFQELDWF